MSAETLLKSAQTVQHKINFGAVEQRQLHIVVLHAQQISNNVHLTKHRIQRLLCDIPSKLETAMENITSDW